MKYGLCVGINNYPGTNSDLSGCVNDANDWAAALREREFKITTLLDEQATKAAMLQAMQDLIAELKYQDLGVITFSGHGTWYPDADGDEKDRRDEAICPHDIFRGQPIKDDELFTIFTSRVHGSRLVFVSDSCHSGTLERFAAPLEAEAHRRVKFLPPLVWMDEDEYELRVAAEYADHTEPRGRSRKSALVMAGCKDTEVSYDAWFDGRPNGAYTYAALNTLERLPAIASYAGWQRMIRTMLPSVDYGQTPQLDGTTAQRRWEALESSVKDD